MWETQMNIELLLLNNNNEIVSACKSSWFEIKNNILYNTKNKMLKNYLILFDLSLSLSLCDQDDDVLSFKSLCLTMEYNWKLISHPELILLFFFLWIYVGVVFFACLFFPLFRCACFSFYLFLLLEEPAGDFFISKLVIFFQLVVVSPHYRLLLLLMWNVNISFYVN